MLYQYNHLGSPNYLRVENGENFNFPAHLHQCFEIITILSGTMKIRVDDKNYCLKPNEALIIFPNQIHSLESTECCHRLCIFSPQLVQAFATKLADKIPKDSKFIPDKYLIDALENLEKSTCLSEKKGILYSLCGQFDKNAEYTVGTQCNGKLLYKIFLFVEENYNKDCSLNALAQLTGYDYSYLSRFFKKIIGISFNSYVTKYRLSKACYFMDNTSQPIIQCAFDSGFASLRNFNRIFKEQLNVTPTEYRKNFHEKLFIEVE